MSQRRKERRDLEIAKALFWKRARVFGLFVVSVFAVILLWNWSYNHPTSQTNRAAQFSKLNKIADVLYESNTHGQKLVIVQRQYHGGSSSVDALVSNSKALLAYLRHHENIFREQVRLFEKFGPERFRCLVEGSTDSSDVDNIRQISEQVSMITKITDKALRGDKDSLEQIQSILATGGEGALRIFSAQAKFALYLSKRRDADHVICGADIAGQKPLVSTFFESLIKLVEKEPTDTELEEFLRWMKETQSADNKSRHEHIAKLVAAYPSGSVVVILIGGSHSGYGKRHEKSFPNPSLEQAISALSDVCLQTFQEENFGLLLEETAKGKQVLSEDTSVGELREIVAKIRKQLKK